MCMVDLNSNRSGAQHNSLVRLLHYYKKRIVKYLILLPSADARILDEDTGSHPEVDGL